MINDTLSISNLLQTNDPFPIDLDDAWGWLGYSRKSVAKEVLIRSFTEGLDFCRSTCKTSTTGRPSELIMIYTECFKSLGMIAGTDKGKEVRQYFLQCERRLKDDPTPTPSIGEAELLAPQLWHYIINYPQKIKASKIAFYAEFQAVHGCQ